MIGTPDVQARDRSTTGVPTGRADGLLLVVAALSLLALVGLTAALMNGAAFSFDLPVLRLAHSWDGNPTIWKFISETANIPLIIIGIAFMAWLFLSGRRREALLVLVMLAAVTAGSEGLKQLVARPRPDTGTADGIPGVVYSFPSGHVLEVMTILGLVAVRSWRSAKALALRLALVILVAVDVVLVAIARMALNAHYPTDILAGMLGAVAALSLYAWFTRPGGWADHPPRESRQHREAGGRDLESDPA